jgi:hypothetical protein
MDIMQYAALTEKMHNAMYSNTAPNLHLNFTNGMVIGSPRLRTI